MAYFLVKTEPEVYSINKLKHDQETRWDGVRNFQARNILRSMKMGDLCFVYHSGKEKQIVGLARVVMESYPDPTAKEGDWAAIDIGFVQVFSRPLTLATIKQTPSLTGMQLVKRSRLSVQQVTDAEASILLSELNH